MRLSATILAVIAFLLAGVVATLAARVAVGTIESRSVGAVHDQLGLEGHDWARVLGDGLQVIIEGEAPTEAARFRAMSIAGGIVDASRVIDNIHVAETAGIAAPDFAIEILRNDSGVSLIGLIPATTDREVLSAGIARIAGGAAVTDLLQEADYPVPPTWRLSLSFALEALERLPRAKISVEAGHVAITAISDSLAEQRRIEADLAGRVPDGVRLTLDVTAPRPVISPFTIRFAIDERGPRFDACSADSEAERETILAAARAAGAEGPLDCRLGLGVPTRSWGPAVAQAIAALAGIGGGTVTFSDADVTLVAAEGTDAALFDRVVGELSNALPDVFSLQADRPIPADATPEGPPEFVVTLSPEGRAVVRGRVHDGLMNETVASFARAQFGADKVTMGTRVAPEGLPPGWSVRVLAGIEALSMLSDGVVTVLPDRVTVAGQTGDAAARDDIARLFIAKLGQDAQFRIDVSYVESLDPLAGLPTPEECVAAIGGVTEGRKITFEPGSATLNANAMPIIDDIAEVLRRCGDLRLRIAGFTDSQGREETNLRLSQQRAESVLAALRMRRVPVGSFEAVGFGEASPIADNETEEGRETNRRIEFSLIGAEGAEARPTAPAWRPETRPRARPADLVPAVQEADGDDALGDDPPGDDLAGDDPPGDDPAADDPARIDGSDAPAAGSDADGGDAETQSGQADAPALSAPEGEVTGAAPPEAAVDAVDAVEAPAPQGAVLPEPGLAPSVTASVTASVRPSGTPSGAPGADPAADPAEARAGAPTPAVTAPLPEEAVSGPAPGLQALPGQAGTPAAAPEAEPMPVTAEAPDVGLPDAGPPDAGATEATASVAAPVATAGAAPAPASAAVAPLARPAPDAAFAPGASPAPVTVSDRPSAAPIPAAGGAGVAFVNAMETPPDKRPRLRPATAGEAGNALAPVSAVAPAVEGAGGALAETGGSVANAMAAPPDKRPRARPAASGE